MRDALQGGHSKSLARTLKKWERLAELMQELYEIYDPDLTDTDYIEQGAHAAGRMMVAING